jgi:hypothetical protein
MKRFDAFLQKLTTMTEKVMKKHFFLVSASEFILFGFCSKAD